MTDTERTAIYLLEGGIKFTVDAPGTWEVKFDKIREILVVKPLQA